MVWVIGFAELVPNDNLWMLRKVYSGRSSVALGSPDSFVISPKAYESEFKVTYSTFGTMTNPATVTMSIGLPADAPTVMHVP